MSDTNDAGARGMGAVRDALATGKLAKLPASDTFTSLGSAASTAVENTFKEGFAQHITDHATELLAAAKRIKSATGASIEGEFNYIEGELQKFAAHAVKFKKALVG